MQQQIFQHAALLAGQRDGLAVCHGKAALGVKGQPPAPQAYITLDKLPPGQAAHTGLQLSQMERLGQIIIGTCVQPLHLVGNFAAGGQDQHRRFKVGPAQRAQNGHAVHLRQIEIEQDKIVPLCGKQLKRGLSVTAVIRFVAGAAQLFGYAFPQGRFILYQQKTHKRSSPLFLRFFLALHTAKALQRYLYNSHYSRFR